MERTGENTKELTTRRVQGYPSTALAKSSAGIGTPNDSKGVRRQLFAGFLLRAIRHTQIMVGWMRLLRQAVSF
ncbi:hypothetical protein FORC54_3307 [Vibrio vulnificus]|nr:hypothetical protein FORC54_3307 [Vibrio vulnificus]